ncbi:hypothetical protein DID78_05990 [Candidatus Marinamargulisbacteria bacterium SCGC AG-343-D04]|nr:hypothetical protein DID78_05990 [Candidatus Marinamargulisbacteria bacterium SCGC AG-343-D04]
MNENPETAPVGTEITLPDETKGSLTLLNVNTPRGQTWVMGKTDMLQRQSIYTNTSRKPLTHATLESLKLPNPDDIGLLNLKALQARLFKI